MGGQQQHSGPSMVSDDLMIERARHRVEFSTQLLQEQIVLVAELRASGRPSERAEGFLNMLRRADSSFREDLAFLQRNLGRAH